MGRRRPLSAHSGTIAGRSTAAAITAERDRDRHDGTLLATTLAPSVPTASGGPTVNKVAPGGVPWVLGRGAATLSRHGELRAFVRGLVIPPPAGTGTPGPVTTVFASLYCDGSSMPVGSTPSVALSMAGDASMSGNVTVPAKCLAPLVLVHPNGNGAAYIAASGFGG